MTQDHGASAPQTERTQAEPEVSALRASIPCAELTPPMLRVLDELTDWLWRGFDQLSADSGVPVKQCREIVRAFHAFGLVEFGWLCSEKDAQLRGRGYWLNGRGYKLQNEARASGIAAQSDETPQAAQPEGQAPGPSGDAQPSEASS